MTPPLTCPQPGPRNPGPDCPLYQQRLTFRREAQLRRAVLLTPAPGPDLAGLVRAEANQARPVRPALPRPLLPVTLPLQKGTRHE